MEVVVARQRISRHVDAGLAAFETRVAEVADRLYLLIQPAKRNTRRHTRTAIINSERASSTCTKTQLPSNYCASTVAHRYYYGRPM